MLEIADKLYTQSGRHVLYNVPVCNPFVCGNKVTTTYYLGPVNSSILPYCKYDRVHPTQNTGVVKEKNTKNNKVHQNLAESWKIHKYGT